MMQPAVGQWWAAKQPRGNVRHALHIIHDSEERYFRWVAREYRITSEGVRSNGARVGISATGLKRSYMPPPMSFAQWARMLERLSKTFSMAAHDAKAGRSPLPDEPEDMTEVIAKWRQDPANDESGWFCSSDEEE